MEYLGHYQLINLPENYSLLMNTAGLSLAVEHKPKEWCLHLQRSKRSEEDENYFEQLVGQFSPVMGSDISRYINNDKTESLEIKPALANRPVVCRPISPITLMPGASAVIYVSTPLWLTFCLRGEKSIQIKEVATYLLSDTWFGASTMQGELCYASRTTARLDLDKLPFRQQRIMTPLIIENKADNDLVFERVAIPVPSLSIYERPNGQLWTQNITLVREDDGDFAKLKLGGAPLETTLVSGPRIQSQHGQIIRAFSAIFN